MDETTTKRIKKTYLMLSLGLIFYPIFVDDERREEKRRRKKKNKKYNIKGDAASFSIKCEKTYIFLF